MIVPICGETLADWARMCVLLYGEEHDEAEFLRERAEGHYASEYLYLADGRPVGLLSLCLRSDYVEGTSSSPVGYLEGIWVEPAYRRGGIAAQLVAFAREWSRAQGARELASDCLLANETSRSFHKAVGFAEANVIVCFTMKL